MLKSPLMDARHRGEDILWAYFRTVQQSGRGEYLCKNACALILLSIRTYDKHAYVELNFSEKIINKMYLGSKA